jgi:hypothetical protein
MAKIPEIIPSWGISSRVHAAWESDIKIVWEAWGIPALKQ